MLEGERPFLRRGQDKVPRAVFAQRTADLMLNALELKPPADGIAYSHVFEGKGSLIDMIFLSADFYEVEKRQRAEIVSTRIKVDHLDEHPEPAITIAPVADFDPSHQSPPRDPLDDVATVDRRGQGDDQVSVKSDHGVPVATIQTFG